MKMIEKNFLFEQVITKNSGSETTFKLLILAWSFADSERRLSTQYSNFKHISKFIR